MNKKLLKIFVASLFLTIFVQGQTLLFQLDLTDTSKIVLGGSTTDGRRTVYQVTGAGTYAPVFRQTDTTKQPIYRYEEDGLYFDGSRYMTLFSGQKTLPSTATVFIIARHLGRTPTTYPAYIIGDTSSLVGYDDATLGLRIFSGTGNYFGRRIDEIGGFKEVLSFRINSNQIYDSLFLNGILFQAPTPTLTLSNNLKFGILGAYHSGTIFSRFWSGYIYEILVYDGYLSISQIDSIQSLLSNKHRIAVKKINPDIVPYADQPMTGDGSQLNPFLIYSVWQIDSLRYLSNKNQFYYIKLMNDIDFSNHPNFHLDSVCIRVDGNNKKIKNWWFWVNNTDRRNYPFFMHIIGNAELKNVTLENFINLSPAGALGTTYTGFWTNQAVTVENVKMKKFLLRSNSVVYNTVHWAILSGEAIYGKQLAVEESEFIWCSNTVGSFVGNSLNGELNEVYFDEHSVLGAYYIGGSQQINFNASYSKHNNCYFKNKYFTVYYTQKEESFDFVSNTPFYTDCCYPTYGTTYFYNTYWSLRVIYTAILKTIETISIRFFRGNYDFSKDYVDTTFNRGFSYYAPPGTTTPPTLRSKYEMQQQSNFVDWDFTNIWAISPNRNDGYPYLKFSPPPATDMVLYYPNSYILKYGGDSLNISYSSDYDTTSIYLIVASDTTLLVNSTSQSGQTVYIPYGIITDSAKIKISNTSNTSFAISEEYFSIRRDTNFIFISPIGSTVAFTDSNITVEFLADIDTCNVYFRVNPSSSWQFKGSVITVNRNGTLIFPAGNQISFNAQVLVTSKDSTIIKESEQFLILSSYFITILSPTEVQQEHNSAGLIIRAMSSGLSNFNFYYKLTNDYVYHSTISVNNGDGQAPDTTTFVFDHKSIISSGQLTILLRAGDTQGIIKGSMDTAYFKNTDLQYSGVRSPSVQFQSVQRFSKIFSYNDSLYTISYYAFAYGWYDWHDRVEVFKYNPNTNFFIKILSRGFPNSAPYPSFDFYRTTTWGFALVKPDIYFQTGSVDISGYSISPLSDLFYKSNTTQIPINIDKDRTTEVISNFWKYRIEGRKVIAYDLINQWNKFVLFDFSQKYGELDQDKFELFTNGSKLFLTNSSYLGGLQTTWNPSATYTVNVFPENNPIAQDEVAIFLSGAQRNYFRGIYPKAIIKVIPKQ